MYLLCTDLQKHNNQWLFAVPWGLKRTHGGILRGYPPLEAGLKGAQLLATFWNFCTASGCHF